MAQRPSYSALFQCESFSHERLKLAENSIRLLQVQNGTDSEPLSLRVTQYSSHRRPPYRAISYTWGSSSNLHAILVNGRSFKIHTNLWDLLFHLRKRKETAFLWADALCIDQANLRERNFHVQLMGRIYDSAESVIVWLGLSSSDRMEVRAMDFIKEMTTMRKLHGDSIIGSTYLKPGLRPRWQNLLRMCQHRYWTRTWIIQEFLRAPKVEVICGVTSLDWDEFENLLLMLQSVSFNSDDVVVQILQSRPARLTLRRRISTATTLHELLEEYHDSMCTEQRDKIYGILGLASDCGEDEVTGETRGITPDYRKHIVEVFIDAVACIEKSLISRSMLPSVVNLVRQTLLLKDSHFATYITQEQLSPNMSEEMMIVPGYVGKVDAKLLPWTSMRDLKSQLASVDWGHYVGYEIRSVRPGLGRRSSTRAVHSAIANDMIENVIKVAEMDPVVNLLHNYPQSSGLAVPYSYISLHVEDKRMHDNAQSNQHCIIIEHNEELGSLRLGIACTNTQRGDFILQFKGLDMALICREVGNDMKLVGKAMMIKHSELRHEYGLDPTCTESPLASPCPSWYNPAGLELRTDALSLAELLAKS